MRKGLLDILLEELNKDRPEGEKIERMHNEQYQVCTNGARKGADGKFIEKKE